MLRRITLVILFAGLLAPTSAAEEEPAPEDVADAAAAAVEGGAKEKLAALASNAEPDPWIVADLLRVRGRHAAAAAFAKAASAEGAARKGLEALADYLAARKDEPDDPAEHERLQKALGARKREEHDAARAILEGFAAPLDRVVRIRLADQQGRALEHAREFEQAAERHGAAAQAAQKIGWRRAQGDALFQAARNLYKASKNADALRTFQQALEVRKELGDRLGVARTEERLGRTERRLGHGKAAHDHYVRALSAFEELGEHAGAAMTHYHLGFLLCSVGRLAEAARHHEAARKIASKHGLLSEEAWAIRGLGTVTEARGDYPAARAQYERARAIWKELGEERNVTYAISSLAIVHYHMGHLRESVKMFEGLIDTFRAQRNRSAVAQAASNLGAAYKSVGDFARALTMLRRAGELNAELGNPSRGAGIEINLGSLLIGMGDLPGALRAFESALATYKELGDESGMAYALNNLGVAYAHLDDLEASARYNLEAIELNRKLGLKMDEATGSLNLAQILIDAKEYEHARERLARALELMRAGGQRSGIGRVMASLGRIERELGNQEKSKAYFEQCLTLHEEIGDRLGATRARMEIANNLTLSGEAQRGIRMLEEVAREAHSLHATEVRVQALTSAVLSCLVEGEHRRALSLAQSARRDVEDLMCGHGEEMGSKARAKRADILTGGALAAGRLGEAGELMSFLESSRAGLLLESLDHRRTLRWAAVPAALRAQEAEAKALESKARRAYFDASRGKDLRAAKEAADAFRDAHDRLREITGRIQREAKHGAQLLYPRAATVREVQEQVPAGTAVVLYGLCFDYAYALVVTARDARIVDLGESRVIRAAVGALDLGDPDSDPRKPLARLQALLVEPLALGASIKQVVLSPEGRLNYVPFGTVFGDRSVALTPSATTHVMLRTDESVQGRRVLALGDPTYGQGGGGPAQRMFQRGPSLTALPATRKEAKTVGDVVLLGKDASERGLRDALEKGGRWRAVHLACHGLVDPERPTLSALALSRDGNDDGFLTVLEVLQSRISADLVVLSACETGTGQIVKGEGIRGLMRAFMFAGSPRVICSLWKVDDEATRALMVKFYALWRGKDGTQALGAAAALKAAQAHVRSHEKWKHPYYWAAWVLWGLPE